MRNFNKKYIGDKRSKYTINMSNTLEYTLENTSKITGNEILNATNISSCLNLTDTLANFKNIMDLPLEERSEKLNIISLMTDNIDKRIGEYLFISKEMVWLIHEIKSFNLRLNEERKHEKERKKQMKCHNKEILDYSPSTTNAMLIDLGDANNACTNTNDHASKQTLLKTKTGQHDHA